MAVLGLCCCPGFCLVAESEGCSPVAELSSDCSALSCCRAQAPGCMGFSRYGSWPLERRLSSSGASALLLRSMWDLPNPGIEPMSPALAGDVFTTEPREAPCYVFKHQKEFQTPQFIYLFFILFYIFATPHDCRITDISLLGLEPMPPATEEQSPDPWTTGEFPSSSILETCFRTLLFSLDLSVPLFIQISPGLPQKS